MTSARGPVETRSGPAVELPAPTAAPLYLALGLALLLGGLVTQLFVSVVGLALSLLGAIGWWRQVLPREREIHVPATEPVPEVVSTARSVEHLRVGRDGHRVRLPIHYHPYAAGIRGGLYGGIAMAIVAVAYGLVARSSPWLPINLLASILLPSLDAADATLTQLHLDGLLVATAIHAVLSILVGLVYAAVLPMLPGRPLAWGGVVAPVVWSAVAWASLDVIAPVLARYVDWPAFVASQIAFGLTAGIVVSRQPQAATWQTLSLAGRAGLEVADGGGSDEERGTDEEKET